ncbi:MAG TPA: type IV secretion system protein [Gemmatimonadales bacterium]|nr:type IV secretion system protein [Gemmatimonadales bacterium]
MRLPRFLAERFGDAPAASDRERVPPRASEPNPFLAARHEFMNAFADLARGKQNWQLIAYALVGVLTLLAIANLALARSARVVPYIVQVDRIGRLVTVGPASTLEHPDDRLVATELARFVRAIRTVLPAAAAAAQAESFERGYAFLAPEAAAFLNDYFASPAHDPRVLGLRLARQVDVTGVLRVPNSDVWRLEWTETERPTEQIGATRTLAWEGYATVRLVPPRTPEAVQDNPLGLSIRSLSWTRVGETMTTDPRPGVGPSLPGADTLNQGAKP